MERGYSYELELKAIKLRDCGLFPIGDCDAKEIGCANSSARNDIVVGDNIVVGDDIVICNGIVLGKY